MCCWCCTTLKVAATWGASIHIGVGVILLIAYFTVNELLGDYRIPYLVYLGLVTPLGVFILLAVIKEVGLLVRIVTWVFILVQIFGFTIRLLVPTELHSWSILQRISALFVGIITTAVYSAILILLSRKYIQQANNHDDPEETPAHRSGHPRNRAGAGGGPRSAIEGTPDNPQTAVTSEV